MANSYAFVLSKNTYPDAWQANFLGVDQGTMIVYASTNSLSSSTILYADSRLTQPIYGNPDLWLGAQLLTNNTVKYAVTISDTSAVNPVSNPTTSTTSTTAAPTTTTTTGAPSTTTTTRAQTTTTSSSSPTTSTTTQAVPRYYIRYNSLGDQVLAYRDYDLNPNVYYSYATSSNFQIYFSGTLGIGTQLFYDAGMTDPIMGNYTFSYSSTPGQYILNANDVFYSLEGSYITGIIGTASSLAWNNFGNNPSLPSKILNGTLQPCSQFSGSGFTLAAGVTSLGVGVKVYSGANNTWGYAWLYYNGVVYGFGSGDVVLTTQSCI